jgi:hypothetical protein
VEWKGGTDRISVTAWSGRQYARKPRDMGRVNAPRRGSSITSGMRGGDESAHPSRSLPQCFDDVVLDQLLDTVVIVAHGT